MMSSGSSGRQSPLTQGGAGMLKARSLPRLDRSSHGLMALGIDQSKDLQRGRKVTLGVQHNTTIDFLRPTKPSDKAHTLASYLRKPSWRLEATPFLKSNAPPPVEETVPKNMKWPRECPAWLKHDKQVLRFYAYFQETVVERWDENCRYRHVVITYHMEDGTMQITEPLVENSGCPAGAFLRRHVFPKAGGGSIGPGDLRVGEEIEIYSRVYHLTGCDRYTRWFYEENGIELAEDESMVQDQWSKSYTFQKVAEKGGLPLTRAAAEAKHLVNYQLGAPPADLRLVQFLENDRKVLRFKAFWDDPTAYGSRIYFTVHYYLADNTCEINEAHCRNSGRDNYPVFYKRGPLYKENRINAYPGMLEPDKPVYMPEDLVLGHALNVWGRKVYLYDCDDFTVDFYKNFLHIDQHEGKLDVAEKPVKHVSLKPPPHNGVGTEEDSLINCKMVQPKPPKQDLVKLMTMSGEVLRFEAKLANGEPEDSNRNFIIGYFPADDCVACWELQVRNSGHMGGKFMEKSRKKNPATGQFYRLSDFAVGKAVIVAAQPFVINRADEHTLQFMERQAAAGDQELGFCHPLCVAQRLHQVLEHPDMNDEAGIDPDRLREIGLDAGVQLVDHEIITLLRAFGAAAGVGSPEAPLVSGPALRRALSEAYGGMT